MAKSLAEQKGLIVPALPPELGGEIAVQQRFNTPYAIFAQPAAKEQYKTLLQNFPDIEDGDPCLVFPEPTKPIRLQPFKCTMIQAKQFYALMEYKNGQKSGKVLSNHASPGDQRDERIYAALIVYTKDAAIPCTIFAKTTKCGPFAAIATELAACQRPEWAKGSKEAEIAVATCGTPFARIVAQISVTGRTSREGQSYRLAKAHITPSGPAEWSLLSTLRAVDLQAVGAAYQRFLAEQNIQP